MCTFDICITLWISLGLRQDSFFSASLLEGEHINQQWYPKNLSTMLRCADCVILAGGFEFPPIEHVPPLYLIASRIPPGQIWV